MLIFARYWCLKYLPLLQNNSRERVKLSHTTTLDINNVCPWHTRAYQQMNFLRGGDLIKSTECIVTGTVTIYGAPLAWETSWLVRGWGLGTTWLAGCKIANVATSSTRGLAGQSTKLSPNKDAPAQEYISDAFAGHHFIYALRNTAC